MTYRRGAGHRCEYCGDDLYYSVTEHQIGGGHTTETRTGPHCDTPLCADKRAQAGRDAARQDRG